MFQAHFTAEDRKALDLLVDPLSLCTAVVLVMCCLWSVLPFGHQGIDAALVAGSVDSDSFWLRWKLLYLPGLFGNYATFPLLWKAGAREQMQSPRKMHFMAASLITGFVNWFTFVPALTFLVSSHLGLNTSSVFDVKHQFMLLAVYTVLAEVWFYAIHRVCHANKTLFKLVHSHHHRITDPHVSNASYQHPVEMLLITMGTAWVGPFLFPGHARTVGFHVGLVMALGNYGHSGESSIHDSHHRVPVGNYGFLHLADGVAQTRRVHVRKERVKTL